MPLSIPAFDQYQSPLVPLRGLWNAIPKEGDRFVAIEIDWLTTTKQNAVQFSLSGNSPVSLSQIVAVAVDNSRSGADCAFIFPDTGFQLVVPAHNGGVFPVFTNALMFYASAQAAIQGDVVTFQVFNSMPPPIPIAPSIAQNSANIVGVSTANGTTQIVPSTVSGTLEGATITFNFSAQTAAGALQIMLQDGTGKILWTGEISCSATELQVPPLVLAGLNIRFSQGIKFLVVGSNLANGAMIATVYYTTP